MPKLLVPSKPGWRHLEPHFPAALGAGPIQSRSITASFGTMGEDGHYLLKPSATVSRLSRKGLSRA